MAERFALENKERLINEYQQSNNPRKVSGELYSIMKNYYKEKSPYLQIDRKRGRVLGERTRTIYHNVILQHWIPYLKKQRIKALNEIDTPFMARFQNYCLSKGIKPQTINHYISYINQIFCHLHREGYITINPCIGLTVIKASEDEYQLRGCYEIELLKGILTKRWKDELSYLLCLLIYSTGMRNSEIDRIQVRDLILIDKLHFIDIPKSKTRNGVRVVPLHDFVYEKLLRYIRKTKKTPDDLLFCQRKGKALPRQDYTNANLALGCFTGYDKSRLAQENITFYSGRHFWKTLMSANDLGEVEEYFMGHRVSADVAKRYNHRDKQGQKAIMKKAKAVFTILDRYLFK